MALPLRYGEGSHLAHRFGRASGRREAHKMGSCLPVFCLSIEMEIVASLLLYPIAHMGILGGGSNVENMLSYIASQLWSLYQESWFVPRTIFAYALVHGFWAWEGLHRHLYALAVRFPKHIGLPQAHFRRL